MSSYNKFQLPPIKGTEVFPETIKSPPVVHASVEYLVDNENPVAPEVLEDRAKNLLTANGGTLGHFVQSQRQNYGNGITDFVKTTRSYPDFDVAYMNIQGRHEIITINLRVDVRRQKLVEEEERDELCVIVFHDGNQVSYAPMTELDNPTGNASRRILDQSNWGNDIIKTSQMKFIDAASSIYTGLSGLANETITVNEGFSFTTSLLNSEISTDSLIHYEWPILSGNDQTIFIPSADIELSTSGNIINVTPITQLEPDATGGVYPPRAWHITPGGGRYSGGYFRNLLETVASGTLKSVFIATDFNPNNSPPESNAYMDAGIYAAGYDATVAWAIENYGQSYAYDIGVGYNVAGQWEIYGRIIEDGQFITTETYSVPMPFGVTKQVNSRDSVETNIASLYVYAYFNIGTPVATDTYSISYTDYVRNAVTNYSPKDTLMFIPFPPSIDSVVWKLIENNGSMVLTTPYGNLTGETDTSFANVFRGWLHVSNGSHMLQAIVFNRQKYMYLDREQITALLGVPVESIQTVLFDIPRSKIEQFQ